MYVVEQVFLCCTFSYWYSLSIFFSPQNSFYFFLFFSGLMLSYFVVYNICVVLRYQMVTWLRLRFRHTRPHRSSHKTTIIQWFLFYTFLGSIWKLSVFFSPQNHCGIFRSCRIFYLYLVIIELAQICTQIQDVEIQFRFYLLRTSIVFVIML